MTKRSVTTVRPVLTGATACLTFSTLIWISAVPPAVSAPVICMNNYSGRSFNIEISGTTDNIAIKYPSNIRPTSCDTPDGKQLGRDEFGSLYYCDTVAYYQPRAPLMSFSGSTVSLPLQPGITLKYNISTYLTGYDEWGKIEHYKVPCPTLQSFGNSYFVNPRLEIDKTVAGIGVIDIPPTILGALYYVEGNHLQVSDLPSVPASYGQPAIMVVNGSLDLPAECTATPGSFDFDFGTISTAVVKKRPALNRTVSVQCNEKASLRAYFVESDSDNVSLSTTKTDVDVSLRVVSNDFENKDAPVRSGGITLSATLVPKSTTISPGELKANTVLVISYN